MPEKVTLEDPEGVPIISDLDQHKLSDNICKNVSFYGDSKVCYWISNLAVASARRSHNGSSAPTITQRVIAIGKN